MAKLLVFSDSHRAMQNIERLANLFAREGYDQAVHLGDVSGDAKRFGELTGRAPLCVRGNCDGPFASAPAERVEEIEGMRLLLVHGDRYGVKSSLAHLSYRAEELNCQAALFGHTHRAVCEYVGAALMLNPGALMNGCFAEVRISRDKIVPRLCSF